MKLYKLLLTLIGLIILVACNTTKIRTSKVKPAEITDLQQFEPLSYITLIEAGNRGKYNDTISQQAAQLLTKVTNKFRGQLHITDEITVQDTLLKSKIEKEINYLIIFASTKQGFDSLKITPILDSLLELNGKRFGLVTASSGFTRTKENYIDQKIKSTGIAIGTLGMVVPVTIKANSTIYTLIIDAQQNNVAFFRKTFNQEREPLDEKILTEQLQLLFKGYFYK